MAQDIARLLAYADNNPIEDDKTGNRCSEKGEINNSMTFSLRLQTRTPVLFIVRNDAYVSHDKLVVIRPVQDL